MIRVLSTRLRSSYGFILPAVGYTEVFEQGTLLYERDVSEINTERVCKIQRREQGLEAKEEVEVVHSGVGWNCPWREGRLREVCEKPVKELVRLGEITENRLNTKDSWQHLGASVN